jgi:magnesium chelatase family protein
MAFAKIHSAQNYLLQTHIVDIEVDLTRGLHSFSIVGLPDKSVEEAKDRISSAVKNSGFESPKQKNEKTIVSLAPAHIKKEGSHFDFGIAVSYLVATGIISEKHIRDTLFLGELSLDGSLREVSGVLPIVHFASKKGFSCVFVPQNNAVEAALIPNIKIIPIKSLLEFVTYVKQLEKGETPELQPQELTEIKDKHSGETSHDLSFIKGQEQAKRALLIAAAGGHNINLYGPPGTGKSMLAKAARSILPPLTFEEVIEVTGIHSTTGQLKEDYITAPPFRSPHHTSSYVSLVGGGANLKPGEVTLAHRGILFLDEFPEFDRRVLETLREPLEEKIVRISRAKGTVAFPADIILVSAMNPCPCGFFGSEHKECTCAAHQRDRYAKKLSGPIVDRIDIWTSVEHIDHKKLMDESVGGMTSREAREKIVAARIIQENRFRKADLKIKLNSKIPAQKIKEMCDYTQKSIDTLTMAGKKLHLSPRSFHRTLRLARTIADLESSEKIENNHILEALTYRPKTT